MARRRARRPANPDPVPPVVDPAEQARQSEAFARLRRDQDQLAATFSTPTGTQATQRCLVGVQLEEYINVDLWPISWPIFFTLYSLRADYLAKSTSAGHFHLRSNSGYASQPGRSHLSR
jgi:hypothetical protein